MFMSLNCGALGLAVSLDEALALATRHGFEGLDLAIDDLFTAASTEGSAALLARFQSAGLRPGAWGLPVDIRGSDAAYEEGLRLLPRYAALAASLGSPWCSTWLLPFSDDLDYAANLERHVIRLRPIVRTLAEHGCRLGLEFVGPATLRVGHRYPFIHTLDEALALCARLEGEAAGLLLDCFHWYTAHGTLNDLERLTAEQIVYVHVNDGVPGRGPDEQIDNERMLPGASGVIDLHGFLGAVARSGFDGPVAVEPFNAVLRTLPPEERVRAAGESLQRAVELVRAR